MFKRIRNIFFVAMTRLQEICLRRDAVRFFINRTKNSFKKVKDKKTLTIAQQREIKDFYKKLTGKNVSLVDHEYFYSRTGVYSKEYMPVAFYETELMGRLNRLDLYNVYMDKNLDESFLPNVRHPHTILKNMNGYYYFEGKPVDLEEAISLCGNIQNVIIKPSRSQKGVGVRCLCVENGVTNIDGKTIRDVFKMYKKDFIIQERIRQHERLSALNPTSVNTIRILTYRSGLDVIVVYTVIRIGRLGEVIDNQSSGGISAKVNSDGRLCKYAFGVAGQDRIEKTDTGIVLEGYEIPSYQLAIEKVKQLHYCLPFFDLVGWDISICEDGEPLLVEWNGRTGPSQTACGTGFGALTEKIISEVWNRPNTQKYRF